MHDNSVETTIVCHARTPLVLDPVEARIEAVQACEDTDLVDTVVVRSWPDTVRLDDGGTHREVVEEFQRFQQWARRRGVSVSPPFEPRTQSSIVESDGVEVLDTPMLCLAIYRNDRLVGVYPHTRDEESYTVDRALERIQNGALPRPLGPSRDIPDTRHCPECDAGLLNGQGMFICRSCAWTGVPDSDGWSELEVATVTSEREPISRS